MNRPRELPATVVQIVPRLPPPPDGVGAYAGALADVLLLRGVETSFLAADASRGGGQRSVAVTGRDRRSFLETLDALDRSGRQPLLLHYANYGYATRGCPHWLLAALENASVSGRRRLVTIFHEVRASGRPWHSSFWLSHLQLRLARRIARLSASTVTTLDRYGSLLEAPGIRAPTVLPVFSTLGEPTEDRPLAGRRARIVVFGAAGARTRAYTTGRAELALACRTTGAREVVDVGTGPVETPESLDGVPVRTRGELTAPEASELLSGSYAGFLCYPLDFLPKSTIFAAYCAHGMLPICSSPGRAPTSADLPPHAGVRAPATEHQAIADQARRWYLGHSLPTQASEFERLLFHR